MLVKNYMNKNVVTISPMKTLGEAVQQMVEKKTNSLIVINEKNEAIGIVSSYLLIKEAVPTYLKDDPSFSQFGAEGTFDKYALKAKDKLISEIMYKDFHALSVKDAMIEAAAYMIEVNRRLLPVVDENGKLCGVINRTCVKNALYDAIFNNQVNQIA